MAKALYLLAVLCSLISQIPAVLDSGGDQYLKAVWVLPFLYLLLSNPRSYLKNELLFFYFFVFIFAYYCFVCDMFTDGKYFTEDLYNTAVSLLMTTVSFNFWKNHSSNGVLQAICLIFALSGTILAINVYINFLQGASVTSATYATLLCYVCSDFQSVVYSTDALGKSFSSINHAVHTYHTTF